MKVIKWLDDNLEEFFLVIFLVLIAVVMLIQIFARYLFNSSLSWPEEFCRYCYIWTVFLSISYTIKRGNMLRVGIVMDMFPTVIQNTIKLLVNLIMLVLFCVFFRYSLVVVDNIRNLTQEVSPAMQLPMWIMYLSTTIAFGLSAIRTLEVIIDTIRNFKEKNIATTEATAQDAKTELEMLTKEETN